MGLVDNDAPPLDGVEFGAASQDHLKRGDNSLEPVGTSYHAALKTKMEEMEDKLGQIVIIIKPLQNKYSPFQEMTLCFYAQEVGVCKNTFHLFSYKEYAL